MRLLRQHHIVNLVAVVDGWQTSKATLERNHCAPAVQQHGCATAHHARDIHLAQTHYYRFKLPAYSSFVRTCRQALPDVLVVLDQLLVKGASLRFMDSTMLEVCRLVRADRHRVAKGVAAFGRNHQVGTTASSCMPPAIPKDNWQPATLPADLLDL